MDLYRATFAGSILLNTFAILQSYRSRSVDISDSKHPDKVEHRGRDNEQSSLRQLKWRFFPIYLLVNAADWLQGPYIYPIYKGLSWSLQHRRITNNVQMKRDFQRRQLRFSSSLGSFQLVYLHRLREHSQIAMAAKQHVLLIAPSTPCRP
jgi:hypothetical protein